MIQRVSSASVETEGRTLGRIGPGLVVFLAIGAEDEEADLDWMVEKILHLRCFEDELERMNLSLVESGKEILCVSEFTLYGDCRRGRRPSFDQAAEAALALRFYDPKLDIPPPKNAKPLLG
ncbi:MAG: D-aminoacyl-tRNA deacylase [candidate division NC10 bacterium]|nr:D-aminoacyl-tRNA deacylase [candidate division NC10 bacterium]